MNKMLISSAAFAVFAVIAFPASAATDLKCGCFDNDKVKAGIAASNPVNGYNLICGSNDEFTTTGTAVSVQESDLKVYVDASGAVQSDSNMEITFRSRDTKAFTAAYDGSNQKLLWGGSKSDNSEMTVGGFQIIGKSPGPWNVTFKGVTTGKDYVGLVLLNDLTNGDGKKTMTALCLQNQ